MDFKLYHIVAMAEGRIIGKNNQLPWHFPADLKFFKEITSGSTVIMGRKTYESIGRPLPNRQNFVLSAVQKIDKPGVHFFNSLDAALGQVKTEKAFIIGGGALYQQTMDKIDGIYLTLIHARYEGDTFYPELPAYFKEESRRVLQELDPKIEAVFYSRKWL